MQINEHNGRYKQALRRMVIGVAFRALIISDGKEQLLENSNVENFEERN